MTVKIPQGPLDSDGYPQSLECLRLNISVQEARDRYNTMAGEPREDTDWPDILIQWDDNPEQRYVVLKPVENKPGQCIVYCSQDGSHGEDCLRLIRELGLTDGDIVSHDSTLDSLFPLVKPATPAHSAPSGSSPSP